MSWTLFSVHTCGVQNKPCSGPLDVMLANLAFSLVAGITESYIITCFYALMTSWAWSRGIDVKDVLWKGSLTKGPFMLPYISCDCCYVFGSKESCMLFHTLSIYQLIFTRATLELVIPTYMTISQGISKTDSRALEVPG